MIITAGKNRSRRANAAEPVSAMPHSQDADLVTKPFTDLYQ
jgi:hypothetical protein